MRSWIRIVVCAFGFLLLHMYLISAFAGPLSNSSDLYRPAFHFSPEKNWINDPSGLVFEASQYLRFVKTLHRFDSFEISDLEKLTNSGERWV
jgi:hypothetical protein